MFDFLYFMQKQLEYNRKMTRSISHEIRTPLNTAFMALDLLISSLHEQQAQHRAHSSLSSSQKNTELLEIAESIKEGCDIALNILNQLLTFEKLSAGMLQLENKTVTINQLLDSNMKLFKMQAQQCGITFKLDRSNVSMEELMVHVDEHKMNQVVRNLLSNAMKFTPRGGVVEVKLQWVDAEERDALVRQNKAPLVNDRNSRSASLRETSSILFGRRLQFWKAESSKTEKQNTLRSNTPLHQKLSGFVSCGSIIISIVDSGPGVSLVSF